MDYENGNKAAKPLVSICCVTFNHAGYLRMALSGMLAQKTNFPFEILIHDDCSTDGTTEIVREYEGLYPDTIRAFYEEVNQHDKVNCYLSTFFFPVARGKYIAVCEGDDYWTDPAKLQLQFDYMENNPDCSLCIHGHSYLVDGELVSPPDKANAPEDRDYSTSEVIEGGGELFATASMFYRAEHVIKLPQWHYDSPVKDYPMAIWLSLRGRVHYLARKMSVYRVMATNSWTERVRRDPLRLIGVKERINGMLLALNEYTEGRYEQSIMPQYWDNSVRNAYALRDIVRLKELKRDGALRYVSADIRRKVKVLLAVAVTGYVPERVDGKLTFKRVAK